MLGRCFTLNSRAVPLSLLAILLTAGNAKAHRLDAQAFVLPDGRVQVESWFSSGEPARRARIEVFRSGSQLLTQGHLDGQGIFIFSLAKPEPIRVVISAAGGHRRELSISGEELTRAAGPHSQTQIGSPPDAKQEPAAAVPLAERRSDGGLKDVISGAGFLLALAAFVLSLRNARRLRALRSGKGVY